MDSAFAVNWIALIGSDDILNERLRVKLSNPGLPKKSKSISFMIQIMAGDNSLLSLLDEQCSNRFLPREIAK
jgi:hypothetical protein